MPLPVPTDYPTRLGRFDDAYSEEDYHEIFRKRAQEIHSEVGDALMAAQKEHEKCSAKRTLELNQNKLLHQTIIYDIEAQYNKNMLSCMGLGALATGAASRRGYRWVASRQGR